MSKRASKITKKTVDIITPVYGGLDFVKGLATSLLEEHDAGESFQMYFVDDATPPDKGSSELLHYLNDLEASYENVTIIRNKVNGGYAKANNLGIGKGRSEYVVLLNSDTRIKQDGWLRKLIDPMKQNSIVGIVGAKLLYFEDSTEDNRPAGRVQHAGVVFNIMGHPYHIFMGWPADHKKVSDIRIMRAVTGACLATRRNIIRRTNGLAEIYTKGNFEDVEFCVQVAASGLIVLYNGEVELYHYGSGSGNTETIDRNYQIFKMRNNHLVAWDDFRYY